MILNEVPDTYLNELSNLVAAVIRMENAGDENKLRIAVDAVVEYISGEDPSDIRDYFVWLNGMFKGELADLDVSRIKEILEVKPMLAELVKKIEKKNQIKGKREGKLEGLTEGEHKGKLETARAMLNDGFSCAVISKYTGLSEDEIRDLKQ